MKLPPDFTEKNGHAVHLNKLLHGLKQAGCMFNALVENTVVGFSLEQCKTDPCVIRLMKDETVILMVAVRVDNPFRRRGCQRGCRGPRHPQ